MKQTLEFINDEVYVKTPLPQYQLAVGEVCKHELVMTKEIFQECYKRWIKEEGENPSENTD